MTIVGMMHGRETRPLTEYLEPEVDDSYTVKAPSMLACIGQKGAIRRAPIITDFCYTITERQDRAPNSGVLPISGGRYRYLTERECWRLQGYGDEDFDADLRVDVQLSDLKVTG